MLVHKQEFYVIYWTKDGRRCYSKIFLKKEDALLFEKVRLKQDAIKTDVRTFNYLYKE